MDRAPEGSVVDRGGPDTRPLERLCGLVEEAVTQRVAARDDPQAAATATAAGRIDALAQALDELPAGAWLSAQYGLRPLDRALLALLLAVELQPSFGSACAYLQGDAARLRPSIELALSLLGVSRGDRLQVLAGLDRRAPLQHKLVEVETIATAAAAARALRLDTQVLALFLPQRGVDPGLAGCCRLFAPQVRLADCLLDERVQALLRQALGLPDRALRLHLRGADGSGKKTVAAAMAGELHLKLLTLDFAALPSDADATARLLWRACREAWLQGCVLYGEGLARVDEGARVARCIALVDALAAHPVHCVSGAPVGWPAQVRMPKGLLRVDLPQPGASRRERLWQAAAQARGVHVEPATAQALAGPFRLCPQQIVQAVDDALLAQALGPEGTEPATLELHSCAAAARALSGQALEQLARRIAPRASWGDLIVPPEVGQQLREIGQRVHQRARLASDWGPARRLTAEGGVTALFAGPSGTGKTLAAEVIAGELRLDLFCVDLASVVSKYIGETEKNLDRVFEAARAANAVLFFDEADALFGKRSEVKDAHDRYANLEIAYLLQKMEQFEGLAVLATNLRQNIDDAFTRRVTFAVTFPFPQPPERRRLWEAHWPARLARGAQVDLDELAQALPLAGGHIRNLVLAAAHYARTDGTAVERRHLLRATQREFQKMGKTLADADWQRLGLSPLPAAEPSA